MKELSTLVFVHVSSRVPVGQRWHFEVVCREIGLGPKLAR